MKGLKCTKYLVLFITLLVGLGTYSNVSALLHEYQGLPYFIQEIPTPIYNSQTGDYELDLTADFFSSMSYGSTFSFKVEGDAYDSWADDLTLSRSHNYSVMNTTYDDDYCHYNSLSPIFRETHENNSYILEPYSYSSTYPGWIPSDPESRDPDKMCRYFGSDFSPPSPPFDLESVPDFGLLRCSLNTNGCHFYHNADGITPNIKVNRYYGENISPSWTTAFGLHFSDTTVSAEGVTYEKLFKFDDLFNKMPESFSYMRIPFTPSDDNDGFFLNSDNLWLGRQFEFDIAFSFGADGFTLNPDLENISGAEFALHYVTHDFDNDTEEHIVPCPATTTLFDESVGGSTLSFKCEFFLENDYLTINSFSFVISGNGHYVLKTTAPWGFSQVYIVTDGDRTPGNPWNTNIYCADKNGCVGDWTPEEEQDLPGNGNADWFTSLTNLFNFGFFNPFAPLFNMFSDNNSCASIPTLASMIHSEETQVCPWFDSTVRNIVTPVLGISSMMLVFGFAVRWLGSSSGNLFEDSHTTDSHEFKSKYRRNRNG